MRRVILNMFLSIDGYIEGPGGEFIGPDWSADLDRWTEELQESCDTLLYGRHGWQGMIEYWVEAGINPANPAEGELANYMNATPKIVFSRSLKSADGWVNSTLATEGVAETVAALRRQEGKDIAVLAGAKFARTCLAADIFDELRLLVLPRLFGGGMRLFEGSYPARAYTLAEARPMDTGAVLLRYGRA